MGNFRDRAIAVYGQEYGWQSWWATAFAIHRRTILKWLHDGTDEAVPGWAWAALSLLEQIKDLKGEIPMIGVAKGRPPALGRYKTRADLCEAILRDHHIGGITIKDAAAAARVTYAVAQRIVSLKEGMTKALRQEIAAAKKAKRKRAA